MSHLWVLYDPSRETQSDKLTTEEAQFVLLRLKTKFINNFLIWRDDWANWKKLNIFLESPDSPFMNIFSVPPDTAVVKETVTNFSMNPANQETIEKVKSSPQYSGVQIKEIPMKEVFGSTGQQFDGDRFANDNEHDLFENATTVVGFDFKSLNKKNAFSQRNSDDRYKIELLLIHSTGRLFRTSAKDISLTGTFSDRIIPSEFHHGVFSVVIINNVISDHEYKRLSLKGQIVVTDARTFIQFVHITEAQKNSLRAGLDYYLRSLTKLKAAA